MEKGEPGVKPKLGKRHKEVYYGVWSIIVITDNGYHESVKFLRMSEGDPL